MANKEGPADNIVDKDQTTTRLEVPREFEGEDADPATDIQDATPALRQMAEKKIRPPFKRSREVIFLRKMIEGSWIAVLQHGALNPWNSSTRYSPCSSVSRPVSTQPFLR